MQKILVIGDVHGKIDSYYKILQKYKPEYSICVGDFGFKKEHEWFIKNIDYTKHKINFGNHDDTTFLNENYSRGNYTCYHGYENELMCVRGASSIDKQYRIKDVSWWSNEELSYKEMNEAIEVYAKNKPKIMITHDCPQSIRENVFSIYDKSITSVGLQAMLELHKPNLWIFGHHHKSIDIVVDGVRFKCLNELEIFELEV